MGEKFHERLTSVDQATLTPLVRHSLGNNSADVTDWHYAPIEGGFGGAYGVYRFQGQVQSNGQIQNWSLVLKAVGPETGSREPSAWNYWKREVLAYQSGLLNDLPGDLVAPRCIEVTEYPGQKYWLWLEDIIGNQAWVWEHFGLAARHLGQFNGAYLTGKPIPDRPWFVAGQLRDRLARAEPGISELPRLSKQPQFSGLLSADRMDRLLKLWPDRQRFLARLDQLPRTLCHHDADQRNLIARRGPKGQAQTVAVDWAQMGWGVPGEDLGCLLLGLRFYEIDINRVAAFDDLIFSGYLAGLRDVGWEGDETQVRFGYAATVSLAGIAGPAIKWPQVAKRVAALPPGADPPGLLDAGGPAQYAALKNHLLALGDEARDLLMRLG